jgi:hypothetical protein
VPLYVGLFFEVVLLPGPEVEDALSRQNKSFQFCKFDFCNPKKRKAKNPLEQMQKLLRNTGIAGTCVSGQSSLPAALQTILFTMSNDTQLFQSISTHSSVYCFLHSGSFCFPMVLQMKFIRKLTYMMARNTTSLA